MDLFKHIFHVIRIVTVKEYPLSEIKQQIRNKVIGPGDRIRVKGYLSCFAPICEPDTFVPKMITYDRKPVSYTHLVLFFGDLFNIVLCGVLSWKFSNCLRTILAVLL